MDFTGSVAGSVAGMLHLSGDGDKIDITPILTSGTKIATFTINEGAEDEQDIDLYAPEGFSGSWNDLTDKPTLFSGVYGDLTGKPYVNGQLLNGSVYTENYSTDEQIIGTWVDGSILYRKIVTATINQTSTHIDISSLNIKNLISLDGFIQGSNYDYTLPCLNFYENGNLYNRTYYNNTDKHIDNVTTSGMNSYYPYYTFILTYTKNESNVSSFSLLTPK